MTLMLNQLIGFWAGGGLAPIALVDSLYSGTSSVNLTGVKAGDLIVFMECHFVGDGGSPPASAVPSGYTSITTATTGGAQTDRVTVSYKIAAGNETSISAAMTSAIPIPNLFQFVFRGGQPIASVTAASVNAQATTGNPTLQSVTAASGTPPLIVFGSYNSSSGTTSTATSPATFSPAEDGTLSQSGTAYRIFKYKIYNSAPSDTSVDMDDESDGNVLQSFYLALT